MNGDRGLREMRLSDLFIVRWWQRSRLQVQYSCLHGFPSRRQGRGRGGGGGEVDH